MSQYGKYRHTWNNCVAFFDADVVVLSSSFVQSKLNYCLNDEKLISPLWSKNSINFHQKNNFKVDDKICIIGTGLSAVDVLVGLNAKNFSGKIYAISRRGNFPKAHFLPQNIIPNQVPINFIDDSDTKTGIRNISLKFRKFLIEKGSIAINGVSLTIAEIFANKFKVVIIPHTLQNTNLLKLEKNNYVNVEIDLIAKTLLKK